MKPRKRLLQCFRNALMLAFVHAGSSAAQTLPPPFTARYEGEETFLLVKAKAVLDLRLERSASWIRYASRSEISWAFYRRVIHDCSVIRVEGGKLFPVEYRHTDEADSDFDVLTRFDWSTGTATTTRGDKDQPLLAGLRWPSYDPMSLQLGMIALAPESAPGTTQQVQIVEKGKDRTYEIQFRGAADIDTGMGPLSSVEVAFRKKKGGGALWLSPDMQWVPVKLDIDGVVIDLQRAPVFTSGDATIAAVDGGQPQC